MSYFDELDEYLSNIITDYRKEKIIVVCNALMESGVYQLQTDIDDLIATTTMGEADEVLDSLHKILYGHLYNITLQMGFVWSEDVNYIDDLNYLMDLFNTTLLINDIEDYGFFTDILSSDLMTEEKVVEIYTDIASTDMSWLLERTNEIQETVVQFIQHAITLKQAVERQVDTQHDYVLIRLKHYHPKLKNTSVEAYISAGGMLGADVDSLMQLQEDVIIQENTLNLVDRDYIKVMVTCIAGFVLCSNTIDDRVEDICNKYISHYIPVEHQIMAGPILKEFLS